MTESDGESEQERAGASDQDYSWYFNRSVIGPEDFDRALEVEKDIEQEKFTISSNERLLCPSLFCHFFGHFLPKLN